jgi:hypothetical protein
MREYTIRITNENEVIKAWIDIDGDICIEQPHAPGKPEGSIWESEQEAQEWADKHVAKMKEMDAKSEALVIQQNELVAQAKADSQKIADIYEMLTQLTNKQ